MFFMLHKDTKERSARISKFMDDNRINNRSYVIARRKKNSADIFEHFNGASGEGWEFHSCVSGSVRNVMTVF